MLRTFDRRPRRLSIHGHAAVGFNVYFREGNARIIPVEVKTALDASGDFTADQGQNYCLEWEAGAAGSILDYRVQQVRPRR